MSVSATLPPPPVVFHGRDDFVNTAIAALTQAGNCRLAVLGSGGMGKTSVSLAILHDRRIRTHYGSRRFFLSCEAHADGDSVVVALARLFDLQASRDLLTIVVGYLTDNGPTILVLDNIETVWSAQNSTAAAATERLLATLAQIPALSLIITCRGIVLPQSVQWTNANTAVLDPFSIEAALQTFVERAGRELAEAELEIATTLLNGVDRMPLAVSLLGQLAQRGSPVSELYDRWELERIALLSTHGPGRAYSVKVSIELSIVYLRSADESQESLRLLSLCSMLPEGLRPDVLERLHPQFKHIHRAREDLSAYALASLDGARVLRVLSPVRHLVLERHPPSPQHLEALYRIYFDICERLPVKMDEHFKRLSEEASPEMGNISTLLLSRVKQPSLRLVESVVNFTQFACWQHPTTALVSALLHHLQQHPRWRAHCLRSMGHAQIKLDEYRLAISSFAAAVQLYLEDDNQAAVAECKWVAAHAHRLLHELKRAESLLGEARSMYTGLNDELGVAQCMLTLGRLMQQRNDLPAAIVHLSAAQEIYNSRHESFSSALCSQALGSVYRGQGKLDPAEAELEAARSVFIAIGNQNYLSQCLRVLATVPRCRGQYTRAEQFLTEAETICRKRGDRFGLAGCHIELAYLRRNQARLQDAISCFASARDIYLKIGANHLAATCSQQLEVTTARLRAAS